MINSIFFFKQKTAYEMRISDWSSDVCSSDLFPARGAVGVQGVAADVGAHRSGRDDEDFEAEMLILGAHRVVIADDAVLRRRIGAAQRHARDARDARYGADLPAARPARQSVV